MAVELTGLECQLLADWIITKTVQDALDDDKILWEDYPELDEDCFHTVLAKIFMFAEDREQAVRANAEMYSATKFVLDLVGW